MPHDGWLGKTICLEQNNQLSKIQIKMDNLIFKLDTSDIKNIEIRNEKLIKEWLNT